MSHEEIHTGDIVRLRGELYSVASIGSSWVIIQRAEQTTRAVHNQYRIVGNRQRFWRDSFNKEAALVESFEYSSVAS